MSHVARFLFAIVVFLLAACAREQPVPPPAPAAPPKVAQPSDGGNLVRRLEQRVGNLNYILQTTDDERQVLSMLYDPLIALNANGEPLPATVARWEIRDGGFTYILHLDPRATFSDGQPVRAADVVFTLTRILDDDSMQFGSWFSALDREKTAAIDERTVRVSFTELRAGQFLSFM